MLSAITLGNSMMSMRINPEVRWWAGSGNAVRSLAECRGEALRGLFPKLAPWRESAIARCERARIEALLYTAENFDELQRRIGEVLRTGPSKCLSTSDCRTGHKAYEEIGSANDA
jgi:hypothetical protein